MAAARPAQWFDWSICESPPADGHDDALGSLSGAGCDAIVLE
jgi:hypothetical protein